MATSATFRCLASGNTVTFTSAYDIDCLRKQIGDYEEVFPEGQDTAPPADDTVKQHKNKNVQRPYKGHKDSATSL